MTKLYWHHRNVSKKYFQKENIKFNVKILRNIDKHRAFSVK